MGSNKNTPSPDTPVVMVARRSRQRLVAHMNLAAAKLDIRIGQPVARATAMIPGLVLQDLDAQGDQAALHRLALWAQKLYSPIVAVDGSEGLIIDATGCAHLFGGEEKMMIDIRARLEKAGFSAKVAIADSWGGAYALARFTLRPIFMTAPGATARDIQDLPVTALRLSADVAAAAVKFGFQTIADLEATAKGPLARRLGLEPVRRLDQAFGREREPIAPVMAAETVHVRRVFAEPIGAPETLARHLRELTVALCAALEEAHLGAVRLEAWFFRIDHRTEWIRVGLARPARDAKRLTRLLTEKLETVDPGLGVERIILAAPGAEPLAYVQDDALSARAKADVASLVDTLASRMGTDKVYRLTSVDSDLPERSVRKARPLDPIASHSWPSDWERPTRLFVTPEPIDTLAQLPDSPPVAFTWRGSRRRVARADGPERVFGEWWKSDAELARSRDYFQVEDDAGERFWIFRDGDGEDLATGSQRWFLHGVFG
jgi:protein ImuB